MIHKVSINLCRSLPDKFTHRFSGLLMHGICWRGCLCLWIDRRQRMDLVFLIFKEISSTRELGPGGEDLPQLLALFCPNFVPISKSCKILGFDVSGKA
jgi:hypothetical protein